MAPVALPLVSRTGSYATYQTASSDSSVTREHLAEVTHCIHHLEGQDIGKPLGHIRQWQQAGYRWLVWVKGHSRLTHQGQTANGKTLAQQLPFEKVREVAKQRDGGRQTHPRALVLLALAD